MRNTLWAAKVRSRVLLFSSLIPGTSLSYFVHEWIFADYIGLGTTGGTIENKVFANFHYSPAQYSFGVAIPPVPFPRVDFSANTSLQSPVWR